LLFSKSCDYAVQAIIFLVSQSDRKPVLQKEISIALNIPNHFLGKILQRLKRHSLVNSRKGIDGGFSLAQDPNKITLYHIVQIIDGPDTLKHCILGFPGCDDDHPCPLHEEWGQARGLILKMLKTNTVAEIGSNLTPKLEYIKSLKNLSDEMSAGQVGR